MDGEVVEADGIAGFEFEAADVIGVAVGFDVRQLLIGIGITIKRLGVLKRSGVKNCSQRCEPATNSTLVSRAMGSSGIQIETFWRPSTQ